MALPSRETLGRRIVAQLETSFAIQVVDLPGHGGSSDVRVSSVDEGAKLLGEAGGNATYIGYSLGGRTCLSLALQAPQLVEALVLIGATPGITNATERQVRKLADEQLALRLENPPGTKDGFDSLDAFLTEWLAGPLFSHLTDEQADLGSRRVNTSGGLASSLRTMGTGTQLPAHDELAKLEMPVLLLSGGNDQRFSLLATEMAEMIGHNAESEQIPGTGRAAPFENPEQFLVSLRRFLTRTTH